MEARPASRVEAVLAARAAGPARREAPRAGDRLPVRVDRVLVDAAVAAEVLASAAGRGGGAVGAPLRLAEPRRWAFVAGPELPPDRRFELAETVAALGAAIALEPALAGLPGVVATDEGLVGSDDVVAGATADVGALGALGCIPLRCGTAELVRLLAETTLPTQIPPTRFVRVRGRLPRWSAGFDLALAVLDALGTPAGGALVELHGEAIESLDIPGRLSLCGTLALAGIGAVVPPDSRTRTWLAARRPGGPGAPAAAESEPPAGTAWLEVDAAQARPVALAGGLAGRRIDPSEPGERPVVECVVSGRIEDLRQAAEVLRDRNARRGLALGIQPASQRALLHAIDEGLAADFLRAGATLLPPGARLGPAIDGRSRALTVPGGPNDLLANPAVVAASAIPGRLMEPESMRRAVRRDTRVR
jgi:3-isopropylmalate/(R)-2-methylmalate dehydratase large subunit